MQYLPLIVRAVFTEHVFTPQQIRRQSKNVWPTSHIYRQFFL